ncbi:MAG TPA: AMP-binding protein [Usitatibacter sp.]|jgi:amino acid adenylation domain-containing protein|nr:AMP-binding protein [Usitatibacter sp.]
MLLHQFLDDSARRLPGKVALVCRDERYTYEDIDARANVLAHALRQRGVQRGDRVVLFLDNSLEMVVGVFAALRVGAVFVPVNPLTKRDKLAYLLGDMRASAMVTQASLAPVWDGALALNATVHTCFVTTGDRPLLSASGISRKLVPYPDNSGLSPAGISNATIDQDLAALIYTSGSTGDAKGVMLTHLNMVSAAESVSSYLGLRESDVVACVLPLAFDYGLYQVLMAFKVGATIVLEDSFAFPQKVMQTVAQERVTVFPGVPTIFAIVMGMKNLDALDLSALRMITNTAAALPEDHIARLRARFPQATLFSMYGLTECKRVTFLPPEQLDIRPTSVGRGMPNEEVWLVDEAGRRLPNGSTGELVIRGSHVMRGYWEKPAETAQRLRPGPIPGEMVLYSGDIFRTDAEGWLYFVARKDDIIKSRGEKVSPREVESAICSLEGVSMAAVIGVPDELLGEAVKAFVVLEDGFSLRERDVIRHCLGRLESFMAPKHVEFVTELPVTDTGKIRKASLRRRDTTTTTSSEG